MAQNRKKITENQHIAFYQEVDGSCPLCVKRLMNEKNGKKLKDYEMAHIYPLNATPEEVVVLAGEEKLSEDLNDEKNLIALCPDCHTKFDKPRTVEEYRELVKIKKRILAKKNSKNVSYDYKIEMEVKGILDSLSAQNFLDDEGAKENFSPSTIDKKVAGKVTPILNRKIKGNVRDYFFHIQKMIQNIDRERPGTGKLISSQVRAHYYALVSAEVTHEEIFTSTVNWVHSKTKSSSLDASEAFVSFFVQNCEVFE